MIKGQVPKFSLVVTVIDTEEHRSKRHEFQRGPVRIGRDPGNELQLPYKFVSSWHAVAKFDARGARVEDLGGANGLSVDGQRVASGGRVEVRGRVKIAIGPVELLIEHKVEGAQQPQQQQQSGPPDLFEEPAPRGARPRGGAPGPTPPDELHMRDRRSAQGELGDGDEPPSLMPEGGTQQMNLSRLHQAILRLRPLYEKLREGHMAWDAALGESMAELSTGRDRGEALLLQREFPPLSFGTGSEGPAALDHGGAEFYQQAELGAVAQAAEQLLEGLRPPGNVDETRRFLDRCVAALRAFAVATVELQELMHRQGGELGVRVDGDENPLLIAESDADLLRYLLDWRATREERAHQLAEVFAAAMAHLRGALRGTVSGGQKVGETLSPREIERSVTAAWPTRAGALWRRFEERYESVFGDGDEGLGKVFRTAAGRAIREELARAGIRVQSGEDAEEDEDA
ncbi:FHA domain-containing protein [Nannocystis bainbridge]|uniref:FHA domain-containing protein n=1 Tax=Nannocystis bainbridge TaxID=2995303 RepID=A0ABT5E5I5_9BACT|nr:FHA domain-containing protein [Nannocystis bainbridge]MDC0721101.1 FHA domain-containing protein [Nannocystis bainbridge]